MEEWGGGEFVGGSEDATTLTLAKRIVEVEGPYAKWT